MARVALYLQDEHEIREGMFSKDGGQVLFQRGSDLNERVSIIITTNLRFADWNGILEMRL